MFLIIIQLFLIIGGIVIQVFIPGFPKELLLLQSGATFGVVLGSIVNWIAMILAAQVGYEIVRRSVETGGKFSSILEDYQNIGLVKKLETHGNYGLFFIRLIPNAPNDILSLLSGALFLPRRGFFIVSLTTAIPYAIGLAYLGAMGSEFLDQSKLLIVNLVLFSISIVYIIVIKLWKKKELYIDPTIQA